MAAEDLVVALTGASGAVYGVRLLEVLLRARRQVHLTLSPAASQVIEQELGLKVDLTRFSAAALLGTNVDTTGLHYHDYRDFRAGIASGSFRTAGMAVCPCSMGTVGAIAHGLSQNLIHRAADVHLKERRRLVLVPRETPFNLVQLRNLTICCEAGAIVLPAMPAFYTMPKTLSDAVDFVVGRVCDVLGVEHRLLPRWGEAELERDE